MDWTTYVHGALSRRRPDPDPDVVEELRQHAAAAYEAARAEGVTAADAETQVRAAVDRWCEDPRVAGRRPRRPPAIDAPPARSRGWTGFGADVRYGVRRLIRQPGVTLLAIVVTALGVGATTTLFSVAYGVLRRPLPWPDAARLVQISETRQGATRAFKNIVTNATFLSWHEQPETIESIAAWGSRFATITGDGQADRVKIVSATAALFDVLRSRPAIGEAFSAADETAAGRRPAVVSFGLWQRRFGGAPDVVGRTLELDGRPYRIAGVMPRDFEFPDRDTQIWIPRTVPPVLGRQDGGRTVSLMQAIARLRPDATAEQASAEGTSRGRAAPELGLVGVAMFGTRGAPQVTAVSYREGLTADVRPAVTLLFAAVVLLLATAVANIAGLQVARAAARRREIAIRAALGAGTARLARQLLTENAVLGLSGGLAGLALAWALLAVLPTLLPIGFPRADAVTMDWRVILFALGTSVAAGLVFGLLPTLIARRLNLVEALVEDSLAPVGGGRRSALGRTRALIMAGQVALAAVLLVGAALLSRSFVAMLTVDRGFDPSHVLTATVPLPAPSFTGPARAALLDSVLAQVAQLPGVQSAAVSSVLPLTDADSVMGFRMRTARAPGGVAEVHAAMRLVSPGYLEALGMRLVEGRALAESDTSSSRLVVVVNRAFVRTYLDNRAIGERLPLGTDEAHPDSEIVGVVDDVKQRTAADAPQPEIFRSYRQLPTGIDTDAPLIVVRTTGDPAALAPALRAIVREHNRTLALDGVMTMEARLASSLARPRLSAVLLSGFAGFAVLIAGVGLFGVLSFNVAQRSREIGIRGALGARPAAIVGLVLRQGLGIATAGLAAGLAVAFTLARFASAQLYGVTARDPASFAAVTVGLLAVALVACLVPARRAARLDPLRALRR